MHRPEIIKPALLWITVFITIPTFLSATSLIPMLTSSISNAALGGDTVVQLEIGNKETVVIKNIFSKYDWRIRPKGQNQTMRGGGPVVITTNMYLRTISKIDDVNMEYNTQFTFRETWNDARLAYGNLMDWTEEEQPPFVVLVPDDKDQRVWMPDAYTTNDIIYQWKNETPIQLKDTVKSSLPSFDLIGTETGYCTSKTTTGEYSCLRVKLHFQRMFSYYLLQLYIPSFMLVIVSWVSFWVDKSSVPARVTLGVTTLLTITTQASGINAKLPPVSYTKAVDVWIGVCLAFVFGALLEYALVNYAGNETNRNKTKLKAKEIICCAPQCRQPPTSAGVGERATSCHTASVSSNANDGTSPAISVTPCDYEKRHSATLVGVSFRQWSVRETPDTTPVTRSPINAPLIKVRGGKRQRRLTACVRFQRWLVALYTDADRPKKIDVLSRFLFPVGFLIFNFIYWYVYYCRY